MEPRASSVAFAGPLAAGDASSFGAMSESLCAELVATVPERHRTLFDATDDGCCIIQMLLDETGVARDYRFLEVNAAFSQHTGLHDAVGRRMRELAPELEEFWYETYAHIAATGQAMRFEHEARAWDRWFEVHAFRVGDPVDRMVAIIFRDIAKRKRAEIALLESEARFRNLADDMPQPVWVMDEKRRLQFINKAYCEFFGYQRHELEGCEWRPDLHADDADNFTRELHAAAAGGRQLTVVARLRRHDGVWRWIEVRGAPRHGPAGRLLGLSGACFDVTERIELDARQEQLLGAERAARASAETAARVKDEFLATLSHELRTPLSVILGWSQLLLKRAEDDEVLHKGLLAIAQSAQAQTTLISDMLDMSSFLLGKTRLKLEPVDIRQQVEEAIGAQEPTAAQKGLVLIRDNLPEPCFSQADPTRFQQILWNLLSNAVKFTPAGGTIRVRARVIDGHVEIAVIDTGGGISPDFLPFLFDRFRQADGSISRRHGGLGLGLSIVQQLAEMHGGSVRAESPGLGHGATFTVRLPLVDPNVATYPTEGVIVGKDPVPLDAGGLDGVRVLAVDDQADILEYLRRILQEQGAQVHTATSAREALALLDGEGYRRFDVVLTDIGMPEMDGYQMMQILREERNLGPRALRAIAVTALARADDRRRAFAAGFDAHLTKPYTVSHLVAAIRGDVLPH